MSEWWTYTLSDFLLFSPRTYERLIAAYNAAVWPAQIAGLAGAISIFVLALRARSRPRAAAIAATTILGAGWLWVAIAFHASRYATINWAAVYFVWAFGLEAVLLAAAGLAGWIRFEGGPNGLRRRAGLGLLVFALAVEPLIGPLAGRGWRGAEVFGILPDPTAIATLGVLLAAQVRGRWAWMVLPLPLVWCAVSGALLLAMKSPVWWIPPAAALLSVAAAVARKRKR